MPLIIKRLLGIFDKLSDAHLRYHYLGSNLVKEIDFVL